MQEIKKVVLTWQEGVRFSGGALEGPSTIIDGNNDAGPGPMLTLLLAAGSCSGSDVAVILEKMRVQLRQLRIDVTGVRREQEPRRYIAIHFDYHVAGEGLDQAKATRAIDLSLEKYCSVVRSLAPDIAITYALTLG